MTPAPPSRAPWLFAAGTLVLHLLFANRYDFFRDELYFIICGRHPAFGYVDQPPLVPLLAAGSQAFGHSLFLLRALAALSAAGLTYFVCRIAQLAGAKKFGLTLAGIAAALCPFFMGLTSLFTTSVFEPLAWTAITYFLARAVLLDERRAWLWAGVIAGLDLEAKYQLPLYLAPLFVALLLLGPRRNLKLVPLLQALGIGLLLALPSALWQLQHHFPFLELLHNGANGKNVVVSPSTFVLNQILMMNPVLAPLWLAGAAAPFFLERLRPYRFISLGFLLTFLLMVVMHAKDYYLTPAYGGVLALGAVAFEQWLTRRWMRAAYLGLAILSGLALAPIAMPILTPAALVRYQRAIHVQQQVREHLKQNELPQVFSDQFGWRELAQKVAEVYHALPPDQQQRAGIFAANYGEAAALDFYGEGLGLPPALSGHNQYFLWGPRGYDGSVLLVLNREVDELKECDQAETLARFGAQWSMPFETNAAISLCYGLKPKLAEAWPRLKFYY